VTIAVPAESAALRWYALSHGSAELFAHASDIDRLIWQSAFADQHKDFAYYRLLEETMTEQFVYRYLLVRDRDGEPIALQPLIITKQDLAASAGAFCQRAVATVRMLWPRFLRSEMLMVGCVVGEGHFGFVPPHDRRDAARLVAEALEQHADAERFALTTWKDFPVEERDALDVLQSSGYTRIAGFPPLQLILDFNSFEEYVETRLSKAMRKNLRRKLRVADDANPRIELDVLTNAEGVIDEICPLYHAVAQRSEVEFEVFTRDYFLEASRRMPGRFRYFVWRQNGRAIAFSFCTLWNDTIYDNDIGMDYSVAHDLNLYHLTFRDIVTWALKNGLRRYCSAPFNYETKLHLRLAPMAVDVYVRHRSRVINALIKRIAPFFAPARSDPALRQYQNARQELDWLNQSSSKTAL
jgi:hypothetical protein